MSSEKQGCAGCKKIVSVENAFCIYECRRSHSFVCCSSTCMRAFEKKCSKASETFRKLLHKLNNGGRASILQCMQAAEREKLKQYLEAEKAGLMICPRACSTASAISVQFCSHVVCQTKEPPADDTKVNANDVTETSSTASTEATTAAEISLVTDDMLLELKKPSDEGVENPGSISGKNAKRAQKAEKKKGQKRFQKLEIGEAAEGGLTNPIDVDVGQGMSLRSPPEGGPKLTVERTIPVERPPLSDLLDPSEKMQRIQSLTDTTGCSEDKARKLLDGTGWVLNAAAEAYFMDGSLDEACWAHRAGSAVQTAAAADNVQKVQEAPQKAQEAAPQQQPPQKVPAAHSQTPPPPLPSDWVAVWLDTEEAYYYWHKPTNFTTWDLPDAMETTTGRLSAGVAVAAAPSAQTSCEKELVGKINTMIDIDAEDGAQQDITQPSDEPEVMEERIVNRHWKPLQILQERCLKLYHGERVQLIWSSDDEKGWAYGSTVDDKNKAGYFPVAILSPLMRKPRQYAASERCFAVSNFQHPDDVRGYLEMAAGDCLKVLHPPDYPFVWAYVARLENDDINPEAVGWVPVALLEGVDMVAAPGLAPPHHAVKS